MKKHPKNIVWPVNMTLDNWSNFFVANAGASAVLTGLIFVGVSINLTKILSLASLPERALISLILLFSIVIRSLLFLVPDKKLSDLGLEILITGFITWLIVTIIDINIVRKKEKNFRKLYFVNFFFNQIALCLYFISGIAIIHHGLTGVDWLVPAFIFSYV